MILKFAPTTGQAITNLTVRHEGDVSKTLGLNYIAIMDDVA